MEKGKRIFFREDDEYLPPKDVIDETAEYPKEDDWPERTQLPKFLRQLYDYPRS